MLFSLKAHACVMSSQALRYSQKAPAGRACSNAWAKRKRKWAKQVWLIGKKKSRLQNSQFFFSQNRFSLTLTRARRASLTRLSLPSLALSFQPRFRFDCSRVLEFAKIRTVLRSRKSQSINQSINTIKDLFILNFANIGRVTATAAGLAKKVRLFGGSYWQFRLNRFLISMVEILYSVFDYQKIKETWVWSLNTQYLFTTVYCKPHLCKVHKENCNLYFLQTFIRLGNTAIFLSVITLWYSISCNINWQSRSPTPWVQNNLNLPVTRQFIDRWPKWAELWSSRVYYMPCMRSICTSKYISCHSFVTNWIQGPEAEARLRQLVNNTLITRSVLDFTLLLIMPLLPSKETFRSYAIFFIFSRSRGGKVSPRKSVLQSACQYDVTSRVSYFQNGEQSVHRRDG